MFRLKLALRVACAMTLVGAILFGSAGRIDLPFFWAYLVMLAGLGLVSMLTIPRETLEERFRPGGGGRDNLALLRAIAAVVFVGQWTLAGLDVGRFHLSDSVPVGLRWLGLASSATTFGIWYWAMRTNPFFSAAVRLQSERGHRVVSSGPYRYVRHPGYAAMVLLGWGGPLALGSWWAAVPHVVVIVLFVHRTLLEDSMLREELDGYAAYAARVRYRFLPGVF